MTFDSDTLYMLARIALPVTDASSTIDLQTRVNGVADGYCWTIPRKNRPPLTGRRGRY